MSDLYRLIDPERRGWKDDEYIEQLRNSGVLIPVSDADILGRAAKLADYEAAAEEATEMLVVEPVWDVDMTKVVVAAALGVDDE